MAAPAGELSHFFGEYEIFFQKKSSDLKKIYQDFKKKSQILGFKKKFSFFLVFFIFLRILLNFNPGGLPKASGSTQKHLKTPKIEKKKSENHVTNLSREVADECSRQT